MIFVVERGEFWCRRWSSAIIFVVNLFSARSVEALTKGSWEKEIIANRQKRENLKCDGHPLKQRAFFDRIASQL